jgi:cation transport protein ChaC
MRRRWVFGYGSLMWRPGFEPDARVRATLRGYRRSLCLYSTRRWGSPEAPGLVMGLVPGGECVGFALGVEPSRYPDVMEYLREREGPAYAEREVRVWTEEGALVATTFVATEAHPLFAGDLPHAHAAPLVRGARGEAGSSYEYLSQTLARLRAEGVREPTLESLFLAVESPTRDSD